MNGSDFYSRMAPWTKSRVFTIGALAAGVASAVIIPAVAAGFNRWVLGFGGQDSAFAGGFFSLQTAVGGIDLAGAGYQVPLAPVLNAQLTNAADTALLIRNISLVAVGPIVTVVWADTPPNVLSNLVVGQYAG